MNLHTRAGHFSLSDDHTFEVLPGGALRVTAPGGKSDLIGPGFWVAVTANRGRLDNHDMYVVEGDAGE